MTTKADIPAGAVLVSSGCACDACRHQQYETVWSGSERGARELLTEWPWQPDIRPSLPIRTSPWRLW